MTAPSEHAMTPQDWFGVGVRLFALWPLLLAVQNFLYFMDVRFGLASSQYYGVYGSSGATDPIGYLVYALAYVLFAVGVLRAAPLIVALAYPVATFDTDEESGPSLDDVTSPPESAKHE